MLSLLAPPRTIVMVLALSLSVLMIAGCGIAPEAQPITLGSTGVVKTNLTDVCHLTFTDEPIAGDLIRSVGVDQRGVYEVALIGVDDTLVRAIFTVKPEREPVMWRANYIDRCLIRFLAQLGHAWLHPWYYEEHQPGETVTQNREIRVALSGGGQADLILDIVTLDFVNRFGAEVTAVPPSDDATSNTCGFRVVAGLDGQRLNIRAAPDTDAAIVTKLIEGDQVTHLCDTQEADGRTWAHVEVRSGAEAIRGWASEEFLRQP